MKTNNKMLPEDCICSITAKIIVEPQLYKYNGPTTSNSGMGIFNGFQHRVEKSVDTGVKTQSIEVLSKRFTRSENMTPEIVESLKLANSKLLRFKEICGDPAIEAKVQQFHQALHGKLGKLSKAVVSTTALAKLVQEMEPFNVGMVAKLQLSVTKISRENFTGATLIASTGMYHKTIKSKQAFRALDNTESTILEVQTLFESAVASQDVSTDGTRQYEVKTIELSDGRSYRTIISKGSEIYEAKQRV